MENYPLDIAAEQVVHWLLDEEQLSSNRLSLSASRKFSKEEVTNGNEARLGSEEIEDLSILTKIGLLEVSTDIEGDGWVLKVYIEDTLGPGLTEEEKVPDREENIDLTTFYNEFIRPDRGSVFVSLTAEDDRAKGRFEKILDLIRRDQHLS